MQESQCGSLKYDSVETESLTPHLGSISSTASRQLYQGFLVVLTNLGCFELCACGGGLCGCSTLCPLALGFKGDKTFRGGILTGGGRGRPSPPVTLRRIGGREPAVVGRFALPSAGFSVVAENPEKGVVSAPNACRRAFSCFAWTVRKWRSSSCHLISSRPSLDRVARGPTDLWVAVSGFHNKVR
jgi:hypothetical protein